MKSGLIGFSKYDELKCR